MLLLALLASFSFAAPAAPGAAREGSPPRDGIRLALGGGLSDLGNTRRIGIEGQVWRRPRLAFGGRIAYARDRRASSRFRTGYLTEPAAFVALHGDGISFVAGGGLGLAYYEEGTERFCPDPAAVCPPAPATRTGTLPSLSFTVGSLHRIASWVEVGLLVRAETIGFRGYAVTLNLSGGILR